eukprot:960141-Prymnesium_polylepis.1
MNSVRNCKSGTMLPSPPPQRQRALASAVDSPSKLVNPKPPSVITEPPLMGPPVDGSKAKKLRLAVLDTVERDLDRRVEERRGIADLGRLAHDAVVRKEAGHRHDALAGPNARLAPDATRPVRVAIKIGEPLAMQRHHSAAFFGTTGRLEPTELGGRR